MGLMNSFNNTILTQECATYTVIIITAKSVVLLVYSNSHVILDHVYAAYPIEIGTHIVNTLLPGRDAPMPCELYYLGSASPQMEALVELHDNIMFYLVIILFGVA